MASLNEQILNFTAYSAPSDVCKRYSAHVHTLTLCAFSNGIEICSTRARESFRTLCVCLLGAYVSRASQFSLLLSSETQATSPSVSES